MPLEIHTQAICLSSFNYRDHDRIATFFSAEKGLIKVIVHSANRVRSARHIFTEPFSLMELTYRVKKGDIHSFKEASLIDSMLYLRSDFDCLSLGLQMLEATSKTQQLEARNPQLLQLLISYLKQLPSFPQPQALACSYWLKLRMYAGLWTIHTTCSHCKQVLENFYFHSSAYYCKSCTPSKQLGFSLNEIQLISALIHERSFNSLRTLSVSDVFVKKIQQLYQLTEP